MPLHVSDGLSYLDVLWALQAQCIGSKGHSLIFFPLSSLFGWHLNRGDSKAEEMTKNSGQKCCETGRGPRTGPWDRPTCEVEGEKSKSKRSSKKSE